MIINLRRYRDPVGRRQQILDTAARLFAQRGFHGVSVGDLGAAVGISGPGLYKHFASKEAILAEMLARISEELLHEGRRRVAGAGDDAGAALAGLVDSHVDFALRHPELIVVQDRDWSSLPDAARARVRALQSAYVDLWATVLHRVRADSAGNQAGNQAGDQAGGQTGDQPDDQARAMAHIAFGLINSTPHSTVLAVEPMRELLTTMALSALSVDPQPLGEPQHADAGPAAVTQRRTLSR